MIRKFLNLGMDDLPYALRANAEVAGEIAQAFASRMARMNDDVSLVGSEPCTLA